ncbi:MAG: glycan-binding surface protein [Mangrovibacterium sp.]
MKNKFIHYMMIANLLLVSVLSFQSCDEDEGTTGSTVELLSMGPTPVLRGGEITIIGRNLNKVQSVIIPDGIEITDFTLVNNEKITVGIPQEASVGKLILMTDNGQVESKSFLGYTEPIEISTVTPVETAIKAGSEITLTGDYLYNIVKVVFAGEEAFVDSVDFTHQERKTIKLNLPKEAQAGMIYGQDTYGNNVYADQQISVVEAKVTGVSPVTLLGGSDEVTISGTDLDLIASIKLSNGTTIEAADFNSASATAIKFDAPLDMQDGMVTLISYSGLEYQTTELTTVVPTELAVDAETRFKGGLNIKISGTNLQLVTAIAFPGADAVTTFELAEDETITVAIPTTATDGAITLNLTSGKSVDTEEISYVLPTIETIAPESFVAGAEITITGSDLDLVTKITFGGNVSMPITNASESSITITTPSEAQSGSVKLSTVNGSTVESSTLLTIEPPTTPVVTSLTETAYVGDMVTLKGSNLNYVETVYFNNGVKAIKYGTRSESTIEVYVPEGAATGALTLNSYDGTEVKTSVSINIPSTDPITDATIMINDYEAHDGHDGYWDNSWSSISEIKADNTTYLYVNAAGADAWVINCNHVDGPVVDNIENYVFKIDVKIDEGVDGTAMTGVQFVLAGAWAWYGDGLLPASTNGQWITISVPATQLGLNGTLNLTGDTNGLYCGAIPAGISFDNFRLDPAN